MPKTVNIFLALISLACYIFLAFFIERHEHINLQLAYFIAFAAYLLILKNIYVLRIRQIVFLAIIFRMVFFVAFPSLSDDFYRFIWDGRLLAEGFNPYQFVPSFYQGENSVSFLSPDLYYQLNSPDYYTIYPPVPQFIFLISATIFPDSVYGSVLAMKIFALLGEIGLLYVIFRILRKLRMPLQYMAIYALNPLVIIEVVGNLHHEGLMLFFLLLAIYLFLKNKYLSSAVIWAFSVATKLIPLMFLPMMLKKTGKKHLKTFFLALSATVVILFIPLIDGLINGMGESISLYFQSFEFNASIYYIVREIGFMVKGYNIIQTAGPFLGFIAFILIMAFSFYANKDYPIFKVITWVMTIFLLFATTVHPWYIISLICFAVFTGYFFPIIWSLLIFMTYIGYTPQGYEEQPWVLFIEYAVVGGAMVYEIFKKEKSLLHQSVKVRSLA